METTDNRIHWLDELIDDVPSAVPSTQYELRDCWWPSSPKSRHIYSVDNLEKKLPPFWPQSLFLENEWGWVQGPSSGDLCDSGPVRRPRHLPQTEVEPEALAVPSAGGAPPGTLEGWQTAADVRWR